jgi:hypothetical protein
MISVTSRKIERVVVRHGATAVVQSKPRSASVRVVQSASPTPMPAGEVADPGDLTLWFNNGLV